MRSSWLSVGSHWFVVTLVLVSSCWGAAERPNILFIYADDQSHRTVSCYPEAYDWVHTPNIDRLAGQGIRFTHAYIGTWCMPSRAALLTGHLQHGVQSMRMEGDYPGSTYDPKQCPFWPQVFRQQGYFTAQIGKWHTGTDTGYGRDWDYQIVWNRPAHPENAGNYYDNQLLTTNGGETKLVQGYSTDNYTSWAEQFIRGQHRDPDKPWYLWLCYGAVHGPYTPAARHLQEYPGVTVPIPADVFPPRPGKPAYGQKINQWKPGPDGVPLAGKKTLFESVRQYHQAVKSLDEGIGRVLKALEESGQLANTLVVYTADQGLAWGQHGYRGTKLAPYDANIRCPLIVSMPGRLAQGQVCRTPVAGQDLVPTFFRFAGLEQPWKMHGRDLTPLLEQPQRPHDRGALMTFTGATYGRETMSVPRQERYYHEVAWWILYSQGKYKYIRYFAEGEDDELYDLESDPEELTNLADMPQYQPVVERMRAAMLKELQRTEAPFVGELPQ